MNRIFYTNFLFQNISPFGTNKVKIDSIHEDICVFHGCRFKFTRISQSEVALIFLQVFLTSTAMNTNLIKNFKWEKFSKMNAVDLSQLIMTKSKIVWLPGVLSDHRFTESTFSLLYLDGQLLKTTTLKETFIFFQIWGRRLLVKVRTWWLNLTGSSLTNFGEIIPWTTPTLSHTNWG